MAQPAVRLFETQTGAFHPQEQLTMDYLIDMNSLFEEYSQIVLEEQAAKITEQCGEEGLDIEILDKPPYVPFDDIRTNIKPDHILRKDGENIAILDTKYYSDGRDPTKNLVNRKQMYRYSAVLGIDEMTFLCPATEPQNRTITPSGKSINVISPGEFSTEAYEIGIREYIAEVLDISILQIKLARDVRNGRIAMDGLNDTSLWDLLKEGIFLDPLDAGFYRGVQEYVADTGNSVPSSTHVKRYFNEIGNTVYNEIKKKADANSEWADVVLPVFSQINTDDSVNDRIRFYYLEVMDEEIKRIESDTMGIKEWQ